MSNLYSLLTLLAVIALLPLTSFAQRVEQVRGSRVLIQTDQMKFTVGQRWEAIDGGGVIIGVIEIRQVKDSRAVGLIREGDAIVAANLRLKEDSKAPLSDEEKVRHRKWFLGPSVLASDVLVRVGVEEVRLTGGQWGLQAGADQVLTEHQILRVRLGFDLVRAKGTPLDINLCGGDGECNLWTHYLTGSLGFGFQAMPEGGDWNIGASVGFSGFLPVSRESDAVNAEKISIDGGFEAGVFAHVKTNPITWIEFSAQKVFLRETASFRPSLIRYNLAWVQNF